MSMRGCCEVSFNNARDIPDVEADSRFLGRSR